jgi:photosystem II stability/assembly factor-like uncharacterized protein
MIKYLAIGLLLACCVNSAQSQTPDSVWHLVNSNITNNPSNMVWSSGDTGFFLGSTTDLTRTTNGGISDETLKLPRPVDTILVDTNGVTFKVFSYDHAIQPPVSSMSWPNSSTGYLAGVTYSDTFHTSRPTILKTTDAGTTWKQFYPGDTLVTFSNIYFPRAKVGFATGGLSDLSKNYLDATTDSGKTWTHLYESDTLAFGRLNFLDFKHGIVFAQGAVSAYVLYTADGSTFHLVSIPQASLLTGLHWNSDSSWLIAIDSSIYRSTDSGKHWATVVPADAKGSIVTAAFRDSLAFAFRDNSAPIKSSPIVFSTRDNGLTWKSDTLPRISTDSLVPMSASMPDDTEAYVMATDPSTSNIVLLKIVIHTPTQSGGNGGVAMAPSEASQFSAATEGNSILFTAKASDRPRAIDVMDILGRVCASISLPSGATTTQLPVGSLPPGSYFARLGGATVKFAIWN